MGSGEEDFRDFERIKLMADPLIITKQIMDKFGKIYAIQFVSRTYT
jgi:hypothetical protein